MQQNDSNQSQILSTEAICRILGTRFPVPLTPTEMAKSLRVTFYPSSTISNKMRGFLQILASCLNDAGVKIVRYEEALSDGHDGSIGEGIVLIAPGEGECGNMAIDHVPSLSKNTVVGILDGTLPGLGQNSLQKRVDALVSALVWHMAHVLIYVDETTWTLCNMNGAIDTFSLDGLRERVLDSLIPKLAAPIVPPQKHEFELHDSAFDALDSDYKIPVEDLMSGSYTWGKTGLLASQTKINDLPFRNNKYRRIASAFLNWRTGMSYGFLAHQLPASTYPAIDLDQATPILRLLDWTENDFYEVDRHICVALKLKNKRFLVRIPEVSVLCTRSGCEKTQLDPTKDLVKLTLRAGKVVIETPKSVPKESDCQPSFDTMSILAHAVGNAIVASILAKLDPQSKFRVALDQNGLALAHWHGFLQSSALPPGYYVHGRSNPPVSCSTAQAAIFALSGKLSALQQGVEDGIEYMGDVHEEPSHGTNVTGRSLFELVQLVMAGGM
jgi:hypothetical protein